MSNMKITSPGWHHWPDAPEIAAKTLDIPAGFSPQRSKKTLAEHRVLGFRPMKSQIKSFGRSCTNSLLLSFRYRKTTEHWMTQFIITQSQSLDRVQWCTCDFNRNIWGLALWWGWNRMQKHILTYYRLFTTRFNSRFGSMKTYICSECVRLQQNLN